MKKYNIRLAVAPIGWSNDDLPELGGHISFEQCIQEMAEAGYQGCEIGHKFPRDPHTLKQALLPYKLEVASAWYSLYFTQPEKYEETITGFTQHMHFLKSMGANVIVVCECGHSIQGRPLPLFTHKPIFIEQSWQDLLRGLRTISKLAKANGMSIVYHHHMGTGIQQQAEIDRLMAETKADELSLLLDTGHLTVAGEDPLRTLEKHSHRIKHVHLKDVRRSVLKQVKHHHLSFLEAVKAGLFTVPGDGCVDFSPLFDLLMDRDYQGWWVVEAEQDPEKADPLTYARLARDFVRNATGL